MGIYDRDYYRNDRGFGQWAGQNRVCHWLIGINVAAFVVQLATRSNLMPVMDGWFTTAFDIQPERVIHGEVWRLLTGAFLHALAWQHIVFNMLALWWFGRSMEDHYGSKEFLAIYLTAAVFSSIAYCSYEIAVHGVHGAHSAYGASGAVTAVLVLFAMHYPTATVLLFFVIPMPVVVLVVIYVGMDILGALGHRPGEPVAFAAHLGGALFGFLYYRFHWRILNWLPTRMSMRSRRGNRPRLRVYPEPDGDDTALANPAGEDDEILEAQLDSVLQKVALHGRSALTERENQILMRASEVYKQRRK